MRPRLLTRARARNLFARNCARADVRDTVTAIEQTAIDFSFLRAIQLCAGQLD